MKNPFLRFANGVTISNAQCGEIYKNVTPKIQIHNQILCVRNPAEVGVCWINAGPLVVNGILSGIAFDWTAVNCGRDLPDLYVEFVRLSGWVSQTTGIPGLP